MHTTHTETDQVGLEALESIYLWHAINRYVCAFKSQQSLETSYKCKYLVHLKYYMLFDFISAINDPSWFQ